MNPSSSLVWLSGSAEEVAVDVSEGLPPVGGEVPHGDLVHVRVPHLSLDRSLDLQLDRVERLEDGVQPLHAHAQRKVLRDLGRVDGEPASLGLERTFEIIIPPKSDVK